MHRSDPIDHFRTGVVVSALSAFLLTLGGSVHMDGLAAQEPDPSATVRDVDLAALFELGQLVTDPNGDSVPDFVNASLTLGSTPSPASRQAATEIAARLGFETMALDLPLARGASGDGIAVVVGRAGLAAAANEGVSGGVDPTSLDDGEGVIAMRVVDGRPWVFVVGGDDAGLRAAARTFAGRLPNTLSASSTHLSEVRDDVEAALGGGPDVRAQLVEARVHAGEPGLARVVIEVTAPGGVDVAQMLGEARTRGSLEAQPPDTGDVAPDPEEATRVLSYPGIESLEVRAGAQTARFASLEPSPEPGPIQGRPGRGTKRSLDLSNLFTPQGLLGDSDDNLIPDRIDALVVPAAAGVGGLPELGARLGLESTGLVVPLVEPVDAIERPSSFGTLILAGLDHALIDQLSDSGKVDVASMDEDEGLIELVPAAFGEKPTLVVTGTNTAGSERALEQLWRTFPHIDSRGKDRPTLDDIEYDLWATLAGRTPAGQAAIGLYKLDQIVRELTGRDADSTPGANGDERPETIESAQVVVSLDKPAPGFDEVVRQRAAALGANTLEVVIDNRDVQDADTIFSTELDIGSEVEAFWRVFNEKVLPAARQGGAVEVEVRLSEPPEVRQRIAQRALATLVEEGADAENSRVTVLSAFKQGYSWLYDSVRPRIADVEIGEILIRFRRNGPPEEWPQQAMYTPVRWLHEIYPIDEILARDLDLSLEQVRFEQVQEGPTYEVVVTDADQLEVLRESFDPHWVLRPYFDRFADYEKVRVTTGWIRATRRVGAGGSGGPTPELLADERIVTDPEAFWDFYQSTILGDLYAYVMDRNEGIPRGGSQDAPYFGELVVELELSEPDYRLGLDNEMISSMDALHEEVYFGTIEFFHLIGRHSRGQDLTHPGRVIPVMRPKSDGTPGSGRISLTGFATNRPAVVVEYTDSDGTKDEVRRDIPRIRMERPSARQARVAAGQAGLSRLALRVRVDTDADERERLLTMATHERVDETMLSAEQVVATIENIEALRADGMYESALAYPGLGHLDVWAEWTHEQDPETRRTVSLDPNGTPAPLPDWRTLVADGFEYEGQRIVQWDEPIPPPEGHGMLAQMARAFDEVSMYRAGESYLGKTTWAADLMPPISTTHWSHAKATTFKPTVIYSARQHANEVSSTSHVLRHAELLLTDPEQREKLNRVNVVIHPFTNADGAQLAYDLYTQTPDYILHAGYLGSLGMDATSGARDDHPIYPESKVRGELWATWLPDVFLNPHGYPSHQVVQLFSEYTGLVRRGRVTERNWGFNKGWFMPGFGYVDDPRFPRHKDAAFSLRDYITRGINSNQDVYDMNQRNYARYRRYGRDYDTDVFRIPLVDDVLIEMPLKGSAGTTQGGGYDPNVTIWSGTTEAPDETAYGPWMELVAKAGLSWDQAILDYLVDGKHQINRTGSTFFGGVSLRINRPRPPEKPDETEENAAEVSPAETSR